MNPDQYHSVLIALDRALQVFQDSAADISHHDQAMFRKLELIRSQVLKAESGHPFPLQTIVPPGRATEPDTSESLAGHGVLDDATAAWSKRIRVLIADDHDAVRSILRALLEAEKDFDVVAEATNGQEAVELAGACRPDIIIMDLNMPVLDGVSATRQALRVSPRSRVIVFSANREPASVRKSAEAGAVGYLCKPATRKVLIAALHDIHQGKMAFQDLDHLTGAQLH